MSDPFEDDDHELPAQDAQDEHALDEDQERERWRRAWEEQEQAQSSRQRALRAQRVELLRHVMVLEEELRQLEGRSGWGPLFVPLHELGWLREAPPKRRALLEHRGQCVLPLGKVGFFVGEGGVGKSWALTQLAIAVATGKPWLGSFSVPATSRGPVLMAMAEEDPEEMHRRLVDVVAHMGLAAHELSDLEQRLWPMPMAGHFVELLDGGEKSTNHDQLVQLLHHHAPPEGWRLLILDPASRFMGTDAEKDNALATRFVQLLEQLTSLPGRPTVLCAHHTNKLSRVSQREGARAGAARGATALTDGARWQGNLFAAEDAQGQLMEDEVFFAITKSNYGPRPDMLRLRRKPGSGVLIPTEEPWPPDSERATGYKPPARASSSRFSLDDIKP